jgi:CBS domain-containing protein
MMIDSGMVQVGELNIGSGPVVCTSSSTPTIEVFQKMEKNNLSGIAVLNEDGKIIGATSGADLKAFLKFAENASLDLSIMQFLNMIRQESLRATVPVLVCENSTSLGTVISKLAATREHRIFVIDNGKSFKPIKVISLSDILSAIASSP